MLGRYIFRTVAAAAFAATMAVSTGCSTQRKLNTLREGGTSADLAFLKETYMPDVDSTSGSTVGDTLLVTGLDGQEVLIMKAVRNEDGEMVAHDVLDAAKVTARFRNIAERNGKVNINFQVIVPESMVDSRWQLRLFPDMFVLEDSVRLEPIYITGQDYRRTQLRGYERYERFVNSIVTDSTVFINAFLLDNFLRRNFREVYAFRNDTTFVSDDEWHSAFGVTGPEAVDHYTYSVRKKINERKKNRMDRMFRRYVKSPIVSEGLRLDTIMRASDGSFIYDYIQQINTRPKLRKVDIYLNGDIYEQEDMIYEVPRSGPLTFYISSLSAFVDACERYLTQVVERRVQADTRCGLEFATGSAEIREELGGNAAEMDRIREHLAALIRNEAFDLDSVVVTSFASPEGKASYNESLSARRAASVCHALDRWMKEYRDSLWMDGGFSVDEQGKVRRIAYTPEIRMTSRSHGEDWETLDRLVAEDTVMVQSEKDEYFALSNEEADRREYLMHGSPWYQGMKERLYPELRSVRLDFHMHRKGMVKDTVHTTVIDSVYMQGVQALRDMDYEAAVAILRSYGDYNAAVAHLGTGHDASALAILEGLERDARVNYMLAVVYSRRGMDREAVECYLRSCEQEPSYVHRGNLDPEISALIERYGLNRQEEEEEFNY